MRWFPVFILAYIALGVQIGLSGYVYIFRAPPNFVLLVVVFIAMNAPRDAALLGCFVLGLMQDMLTGNTPLGLMALSYGMVGMFVVSTQEIVYREHFLTHLSLTLAAGLLVAILTLTHGLIYPLLHSTQKLSRPPAVPLLTTALYTALLAPIIIGLLQRMKRVFGFRGGRGYGMRRDG